ncbi:hypothetical protein C3E97_010755 [Pseudomonas sp. MWU12-2115]|nr:hypothetical protein C3E97_010755 [Pseudomonas sp. MWU12-2115]
MRALSCLGLGILVASAGAFASKPAPTGLEGVHKVCGSNRPLWERACSRKGRYRQQKSPQTITRLRASVHLA